jgi:hypothetical protein
MGSTAQGCQRPHARLPAGERAEPCCESSTGKCIIIHISVLICERGNSSFILVASCVMFLVDLGRVRAIIIIPSL